MARKARKVSTARLIKLFHKYEGSVYSISQHVKDLSYMGIRRRLIVAGVLKGKTW